MGEEHFLGFSKNKLNHHNTHEISSLQYKLDRKNSIKEYAAFKIDSFFSKKNLAKQGNLRKNIGLNKKIFFFFINNFFGFFVFNKEKKKKIFNLKKKENAQKIF